MLDRCHYGPKREADVMLGSKLCVRLIWALYLEGADGWIRG